MGTEDRKWQVELPEHAEKKLKKLPKAVQAAIKILSAEIEDKGPVRGNWPNYSKLGQNLHHCHLKKKGKPAYVCVWEVKDKKIRIVSIEYIGTREKAPY